MLFRSVRRDRDRLLQLLILNEEFLVNADHQSALITSLPFCKKKYTNYLLYKGLIVMSIRFFVRAEMSRLVFLSS